MRPCRPPVPDRTPWLRGGVAPCDAGVPAVSECRLLRFASCRQTRQHVGLAAGNSTSQHWSGTIISLFRVKHCCAVAYRHADSGRASG